MRYLAVYFARAAVGTRPEARSLWTNAKPVQGFGERRDTGQRHDTEPKVLQKVLAVDLLVQQLL